MAVASIIATMRCSDGCRIAFDLYQAGDSAPRIALVHSLAMDRTFWAPLVERLAGKASILTYDCRGHGASDKMGGPYTTQLFARDLAELMDHIGWRSAIVAGASMGGSISLAFAVDFPERVKGLGLIDTTAWYGDEAPAQWAKRADKAMAEGLQSLVDFQTTRWFGDTFRAQHPEIVRHCVDVFLANEIGAYAETCRMLGAHNVTSALRGISCPTRVIVGEEDYATPVAMAQTLHANIKGSNLVVIEKARHLTPLEVPDRVASEIDALLKDAA